MPPEDQVYDRMLRKITLRLLPFMFLLYIISYLDRINISFAGAPMSADLHFNDEVFGFGLGVFFLGYCFFGVPSNLALQKFGARKWISLIMVLWGFVSVFMAFVPNTKMFFGMRFLLGAAEAGFFPGMIFYLTKWFRKREHGMAVAKFMSAVPAAGILGGLIASKILGMPPLMGLPPWKWLFIITGTPAIILGLVVLFYLPDGPADAKWLSDDERKLLKERLDADSAAPIASDTKPAPSTDVNTNPAVSTDLNPSPAMSAGSDTTPAVSIDLNTNFSDTLKKRGLVATLLNPKVWTLALLYFSCTLGMYGFQLWLPQIISATAHGDDSQTALLSAIPAAFQAIGMIVIARSSDKTGERRWHLAASASIAVAGLVVASVFQNPVIALTGLCLTAFGIWGTVGPFWALPRAFLTGTSAAAAIALINSVGNLGGFAGPYIVGAIKLHSANFASSLLFMAGSLLFGAVLAVSMPKTKTE